MCLGVPSKVIAINEGVATVQVEENVRDVSLLMLEDPIEIGDYLLIQVGGFAYQKLSEQDALETLHALSTLDGFQRWDNADE
jgi:hydrogenase expression/formation protein HypC